MRLPYCLILALAMTTSACQPFDISEKKSLSVASSATRLKQQTVKKKLDLTDQASFAQANKGLIATAENLQVRNANNDIIWDN